MSNDVNVWLQLKSASVELGNNFDIGYVGYPEAGIATMHFHYARYAQAPVLTSRLRPNKVKALCKCPAQVSSKHGQWYCRPSWNISR